MMKDAEQCKWGLLKAKDQRRTMTPTKKKIKLSASFSDRKDKTYTVIVAVREDVLLCHQYLL